MSSDAIAPKVRQLQMTLRIDLDELRARVRNRREQRARARRVLAAKRLMPDVNAPRPQGRLLPFPRKPERNAT